MTFPRMLSALLMGLGAVACIAAEAGLPDGVALPAGMSVEQAKATAQSQGITTRAQAEAVAREQGVAVPGSVAAAAKGPKLVKDDGGDVDPSEGDVLTDGVVGAQGDSLNKGKEFGDPAPLRYGQAIFRKANPSLFASHVGAVGSSYQLGAGDEIILTLWGQKEARYELTLDRSGQVSVEGVGLVSLNGLSLKGAQELLQKRLMRIYAGMGSGQTSMDLTLGKIRQIRVFVNGDVVAPGSYLLSGNTNVFNALYQAKGPTSLGSERKIEIVRGSSRFEVDLYSYLFKGVRQVRDILQDGDIVRVPVRGPVVSIKGDVGRPGTYELLPSETTKDLFVYCGGIKVTTATQSVLAMRILENGRKEAVSLPKATDLASGKATAPLKDGDELLVFQGNDPSKQTVLIEGEVRFPGAYPWKDGMKAADLIELAGGYTTRVYAGRGQLTRALEDGSNSMIALTVKPLPTAVLMAGDRLRFFNRFEMLPAQHVRISGAVARPGSYLLDSGMTIRDLVLLAGGLIKDADPGNARLELPLDSAEGARVEIVPMTLGMEGAGGERGLSDGAHLAIPFLVFQKTLDLVTVRGMVAYPGAYSLQNATERMTSVLARAGGIRGDGYASGVQLHRPRVGRISINAARALARPGSDDDLVLQKGDTLTIPTNPATVKVSGRVNNPANIPWRQGKDWKWYLSMAGGMTDSSAGDQIYVKLADGSIQTRDYGIDSLPNPGSEVVVPFRKPAEPLKYTDIIGALGATASLILSAVTIFLLVSKD